MPKITYQEIRPGKWFKLVDGQIVAAATPSEVAAWRRYGASPGSIWQDVVKTTRPTAGPAEKPGAPAARESQQDAFWKDIVKSTKTQPRAQSRVAPAEDRTLPLRPRGKEDIDVAEQASIWRDVLNQSKKRVQPAVPPAAALPAKAKEPEKPASPKVKTPDRLPAVEAAPSPKVKRSPVKDKSPVKAKAPPAAGKKRPAVVSSKPRPASSVKAPATRTSTEETAKPARIEKKPPAKAPRAAEPSSAPRRRPQAATAEPSAPLYLWMVAGQSDDLLAIARTGLARYQQRFERPAEVVLCHSEDLPALEGKLTVDLREGKSLPRRNIWIGLK